MTPRRLEKRDSDIVTMAQIDTYSPRGVLHQRLPVGEFQHARRAPSMSLAWVVEHYWYVSWDLSGLPAQTQETLPHPNVHYVIEAGHTGIYGVHSGRFSRLLEGKSRVFGIKFKPGGFYPFYRQAVSALADTSMAASDIFGADALAFEKQTSDVDDIDVLIENAEQLLLSHMPCLDPQVARIAALVALVANDRSITCVDALASHAAITKRSLQRWFDQYVGISPKWVINRYRLHEAIAQLQRGEQLDWKDLALSLGYFDQAHFIRDFRKLVGKTPGDYARSETTFPLTR